MNKFLRTFGLLAVIFTTLRFFTFYSASPIDDKEHREEFNSQYAIYSLPLPKEVDLAGEPVPMEDPQVREAYDQELLVNTYWQSQTLLFLKRKARYFPQMRPIFQEHGIPEDLLYLSLIESGLTQVKSPAGAVSFWQIMESTGREYGLEISEEVDERYHLEKSTHAACRYLKKAYQKLGSWTLAAASYNMGMSGVQRQLKRQSGDNFYDLTLNPETARYLYRLLAVQEIMEHPRDYGFHLRPQDSYDPIPTHCVAVDTAIDDLGKFANELGINYRILKFHNPWLRYEYLPRKAGKTYQVEIPEPGHYQLAEELKPIQKESKAPDSSAGLPDARNEAPGQMSKPADSTQRPGSPQ